MTETAELMAQLDRHVQALDSAGVAAWCREVGPKQLRSMRTTIAAFAEKQYRHYDRNESWLDAKRRAGAAALAVLASASTVNKAAAGIDYSAVSIDLTAAVDLMAELRPSWLDGLAERLLKNRSATHWNLGHALQAAGLTTKPSGREYLVQMASSLFPVARKLREHPELIDDMWRLFDDPSIGIGGPWVGWAAMLDLEERLGEPGPEESGWVPALLVLSAEGTVSRDRLIDSALRALQIEIDRADPRSYLQLLKQLGPTHAEKAGRAETYSSLQRSTKPAVVKYGLSVVKELLASDSVRPDIVLEHADGPFFLGSKSLANPQIALLKRIGRAPEWRDAAALSLGAALGHTSADVQARAIDLVAAWWSDLSAETQQALNTAARALAPSLMGAWAVATGAEMAASGLTGAWTPPPRERMPAALDEDQLVLGLASAMEGTAAPILFDRVIEGVLRVASMSLGARRELFAPVASRAATNEWPKGQPERFAAVASLMLAGVDPQQWTISSRTIGGAVLREVLQSVAAGESRPYLAMPQHVGGRIDPAEARKRLAEAPGSAPASRRLCALRSDADHQYLRVEASWEPSPVPDPCRRYRCHAVVHFAESPLALPPGHRFDWLAPGLRTEFDVVGTEEDLRILSYVAPESYNYSDLEARWQLTLVPHHLDLLAIAGASNLAEGIDKEPSPYTSSGLRDVLEALVSTDQPAGPLAPFVVGMGLGAKAAVVSTAAVDAAIALCSTERSTVDAIVSEVGRLVDAKIVKPVRLAKSLAAMVQFDPALARDLSIAILERIGAARDAAAVASVACDAAALAGVAPLPAGLREIASAVGSSRLQRELRRFRTI